MSDVRELATAAVDVETVIRELAAAGGLRAKQLLVLGVSTSEVLGQRIGTSGTLDAAQAIYAGMEAARRDIGFYPVFQCCEHLNRALVMEREAAEQYGLELVHAIPVPKAGGSMAAYAFKNLPHACLTETVQAHAGIDIGDTFIGMHLHRVAVPLRPSIRSIGAAHLTMAYTRPKLIGGARAVYTQEADSPEAQGGTCD